MTPADRFARIQQRLAAIKANQIEEHQPLTPAQKQALLSHQVKESIEVVNTMLKKRDKRSESVIIQSLRETVASRKPL